MKRVNFFIVCIVVVSLITILFGLDFAVAKKEKKDLGPVAVVIRTNDIDINYSEKKAEDVTGSFLGGIGGAIIKHQAGKSKKGEDAVKEKELKSALGDWNMGGLFKDPFMKNLRPQYKDVTKVVVAPQDFNFQKVNRKFYKKGKKYDKNEAVYDYTPLAGEGINTVVDVVLNGYLTATNVVTGTLTPSLVAKIRVISLGEKKVISDKVFESPFKGGVIKRAKINPAMDMDGRFEKFAANNGKHTKYCFTKLADEAATMSAKKLK